MPDVGQRLACGWLVMKPSHAEGTSTVTCLCGKASLTFAANPGVAAECGCFGCREKFLWAAAQAERQWDVVMQTAAFVVDDLVHVTGEAHLRLTRLRHDSRHDFVLATCCHSVLAAVGAYYRGNFVAIFPDSCTFHGHAPKSSIRFSAGDVNGTLPPYLGDGVELDLFASHYSGENPKGTETEQEAVRTFFAHRHASAVLEGHGPGKHGETVYALMARLSGTADPHVIGLPPLDPDPDR
ncbi:MAG: hypothetical protein EBQ56_02405 [Proteobacteria bacterium]|nr:hypothetical protein [Pseudomonadota bacterium]